MTVVASDGNPIAPTRNVTSLVIKCGERYDFEIETKDLTNRQNFFIVLRTLESIDFFNAPMKKQNYGVAMLRYFPDKNSAVCSAACDIDACRLGSGKPCKRVNCPFWNKEAKQTPNGLFECVSVADFRSRDPTPPADLDLLRPYYPNSQFEEHFLNFHFAGAPSERNAINGRQFVLPAMPPFYRAHFEDAIRPADRCTPGEIVNGEQCTYTLSITPGKVIIY